MKCMIKFEFYDIMTANAVPKMKALYGEKALFEADETDSSPQGTESTREDAIVRAQDVTTTPPPSPTPTPTAERETIDETKPTEGDDN